MAKKRNAETLEEEDFDEEAISEGAIPIYEQVDLGQMGAAIKSGNRKARKRLAVHRATGEWTRAS
jgi:hypothetical protein